MSRQDDFVTEIRQLATDILRNRDRGRSLRSEWDELNYGTTLDQFNGENAAITTSQIGDVFNTLDALTTTLAGGHAHNLQEIRH